MAVKLPAALRAPAAPPPGADHPPLDIFVVTGFLGSGKSTFLQHVLATAGLSIRRTALILNDAGPVNIDARQFRGKAARIYALTGGCACCTTPTEMIRQIETFADDPAIDRVWIEASGVADTEDLLDRLTEPALLSRARIRQVVYVIDSGNFRRWHPNRWVHEEQARWADLVLLNKADSCTPSALKQIRKLVASWNTRADIQTCEQGRASWSPPAQSISEIEGRPQKSAAAHPLFTSHWWAHPEPVDEAQLRKALASLPENVLRIKGFLRVKGRPGEIISLHRTGPDADPILWAIDDPDAPLGLVLLGQGFNPAQIDDALADL